MKIVKDSPKKFECCMAPMSDISDCVTMYDEKGYDMLGISFSGATVKVKGIALSANENQVEGVYFMVFKLREEGARAAGAPSNVIQ